MEIAVIADVHSNLPALEEVLKEVGDLEIFNCGDIVGYNPFPVETVELFMKRNIKSVLGNHDFTVTDTDKQFSNTDAAKSIEWTKKMLKTPHLEYLKALPRSYSSKDFIAFHGSPQDPLNKYIYPNHPMEEFKSFLNLSKIVILGHSHIPFIKEFKEGIVFNPGSVGQPRDGNPKASFALLDTEDKKVEIKRTSYDIDRVAGEIKKQGLSKSLADRLYQGR